MFFLFFFFQLSSGGKGFIVRNCHDEQITQYHPIQSIPFQSNPPTFPPINQSLHLSHTTQYTHTNPPTLLTDGIELSPDYKHIYVTDTGVHTFAGKDNATDPANIYKFDITPDGKRLENRQVFAYSERGFPDGIHTDTEGNVYSAMSDGVHV